MHLAAAPAFEVKPRDPRLAQWLTEFPPDIFGDRLYQSIELMERYSIALAGSVLRELGVADKITDYQSADQLCASLSLKPQFASALRWLLERLVETDCIERRDDSDTPGYRAKQHFSKTELARLRSLATGVDSANTATLDLLDHAASIYPIVARGEQTGEQSMFGPKGIALWLSYFNNNNITYAVNNWVGALSAADRVTNRTSLRILEVGAGAGSATAALLQALEQRNQLPKISHYLVTEPNAFFRRRAQREITSRYQNVPLEWRTLDLDLPWADQLNGSNEFDLVFAVNVFHVSKDLEFSLKQAMSALANGGRLVVGECVRPFDDQPIYPELMFQVLESFNDVTTDPEIRPRPGFLTPEDWRSAFARAGFTNIEVVPEIEKIRDIYSHFFTAAICGQKPLTNDSPSGRS